VKNTLETARQYLRRFVQDDAAAIFELNDDPLVMRFTGDQPFASVEAARDFLAGYNPYDIEGFGRWACVERGTGAFLGWCGLRVQKDGDVDIGYRYLPQARNRGFATEASLACLAFGFEKCNLPSIIGRAHAENVASIRVLQKLGMGFEKEFELEGMPSVCYRIDAEAWRARRA
jgi:RimJ/RimL family protein N-acetyltransferase